MLGKSALCQKNWKSSVNKKPATKVKFTELSKLLFTQLSNESRKLRKQIAIDLPIF